MGKREGPSAEGLGVARGAISNGIGRQVVGLGLELNRIVLTKLIF